MIGKRENGKFGRQREAMRKIKRRRSTGGAVQKISFKERGREAD
jgi:hypothetical protein